VEISPLNLEILAALAKFVAIYGKNDNVTYISTNAARAIEELAFILVSVSNRSLSRVHDPIWKFPPPPLNLEFLAALVKFVPLYQKIAEFTDISTNAARETEQLAFTLPYLVGLIEHCQWYMPHCGNFSLST